MTIMPYNVIKGEEVFYTNVGIISMNKWKDILLAWQLNY